MFLQRHTGVCGYPLDPRFEVSILDFGRGFRGAVSYYYQSSVDWISAPPVDSYDRLDLNLRKTFDLGRVSGRLELVAQNVFGDDYTEYRQFQEFDTRYYLRLVTEF